MSGNPFRASLVQKPVSASLVINNDYADSNRNEAGQQDSTDSVHGSKPLPPAKTKKSVRIESPTSSPPHSAFNHVDYDDDTLQQRIHGRHPAVLSSLTKTAAFSVNVEDYAQDQPIGKREEGRGIVYGASDVTESEPRYLGRSDASLSPGRAPVNPFSKTLATIEKQEKEGVEAGRAVGQNRDWPVADKTAIGPTKSPLDVESFKRLLMTGIQSPSSSGQPSQTVVAPPAPASVLATAPIPINPSLLESSSSTDTSSVSRQSIFEPVQEPHMESPRTSYEMAASDEDDRVALTGDTKRTEKKKPPPPRRRHGKPVTSRTPQIVSFSDFSATQPTLSPISGNGTDSDLNKPLPLPPILSPTAHIVSHEQTQDEASPLEMKASESSNQSNTLHVQKRLPPPVPMTRRQSQLRSSTAGNRSRSNSSLTMSSQHSIEYSVLSPGIANEPISSPASQKAPPPPPPARRHGANVTSTINPPSNNSSTTELPSTPSIRHTPVSSPNPPSSRKPAFSSPPPSPGPGLARTSSVSSNLNPRSVSNESAGVPPPPPPPRRRRSGRSSLEKERPYPSVLSTSPTESRRTSSENKRTSIDSKRRTSVASESSLRHEYARASENEPVLCSPQEEMVDEKGLGLERSNAGSGSVNVLDDMEKFQREIDELRAKYEPVS